MPPHSFIQTSLADCVQADKVIIGGGMIFTFYKARGLKVVKAALHFLLYVSVTVSVFPKTPRQRPR